jgi:hypothetical protein
MTKTILRDPELGNMKGKTVNFNISETPVILCTKGTTPNASYISTLTIRENKGGLTASAEIVHYHATATPPARATHIRDSDTGRALLSRATVSVYENGQSGRYNPYAKENMRPLPIRILLDLDD